MSGEAGREMALDEVSAIYGPTHRAAREFSLVLLTLKAISSNEALSLQEIKDLAAKTLKEINGGGIR